MSFRRQIFLPIVASLFLAACGDSSPTDPGGGAVDTREIKSNPSFANDVVEIFTRQGCTAGNCHGNSAGNLTLTSSASGNHARLVGVTSPNSGEVYVIVNDADNSYLVKKLEGRQGSGNGSRMPLAGGTLDNIDLTNIKNWINTGAPNN